MTPEPGDSVPSIEAPTQNADQFSPDFEKPTVLYFYPEDFTPGCEIQAKEFTKNLRALGESDVQVIGVSGDTADRHHEFAEEMGITYPLLADPDGEIADAFGVGTTRGRPARTTFLIRDGEIREVHTGVNPAGHAEAVLSRVRALEQPESDCPFRSNGGVTWDVSAYERVVRLDQPEAADVPEIVRQIDHPSVVVVTGGRGNGKSSLAYHIADEMHQRDGIKPVAVGLPKSKHHELPDAWRTVERVPDAPPNSVSVVDEAYAQYHSREGMKKESVAMSKLVNLSRHCDRTILFVSQNSAQLDKNAVGEADMLMMKEPSTFHQRFERAQVRDLTEQAKDAFDKLPQNMDRREYTYVFADGFEGMIQTGEADFYGEGLSHSYEGVCSTDTTMSSGETCVSLRAKRAVERLTE